MTAAEPTVACTMALSCLDCGSSTDAVLSYCLRNAPVVSDRARLIDCSTER